MRAAAGAGLHDVEPRRLVAAPIEGRSLMQHRARSVRAVLLAAGILAVAVSAASATRIAVSNPGIRIVWSVVNFNNGEARCAVTMEGTLHSRTITKTGGLLIGYITRGRITRPCEAGTAWFLTPEEIAGTPQSLPWHLRYDSFVGTLPDITSTRWQIIGMKWKIRNAFGGECLYESTATNPVFIRLNRSTMTGAITGVEFDATRTIPRKEGAGCQDPGSLSGSGTMTLLETTTAITLTLVV
jgi:hypothetical protein